ncbi:MAG TPA: hypothetical protein VH187_22945 [Scandinavium sp.]|jgi:hypothetical protein|uniref:hypothetical protein n=1 Tax=Scandinavium sp. TaxID=2830653 RepID=UPI002E35B07E|nr:hypothetical protein [Scandinavium sp.]HEX4503987.1 hypothetical protein [Scandinavium sp.]
MSNGPIRQVNFSLHLRPDSSKADERVLSWLNQWHSDLKQGSDDRNNANMEIRAFHRNVYLAGLQLQLLEPQLCNAIAESISREDMTLPELVGKLVREKLMPEGVPMAAVTGGKASEFTSQQLSQLEQLLSQHKPEVAAAPSGDNGLSADQQAEFQRVREELNSLKGVLNQQTRLLQQLQRQGVSAPAEATKGDGTEESDLSALSAPTEKMQKIKQKGIF